MDGAEGWYIPEEKYVIDAVNSADQNLGKSNQRLPTRGNTPIMFGYWPETDTPPNLNAEGITR